jgi:hypothetical protein
MGLASAVPDRPTREEIATAAKSDFTGMILSMQSATLGKLAA